MTKTSLTQRRRSEKAVIDALLKISEIVQKTEISRQHQKSINTNQRAKKIVGNGDYNELYNDDEQQQQVPVPPPMRTLDSYISEFNQQSFQRPSNCNQASTVRLGQCLLNSPSHSREHNIRDKQLSVEPCSVQEGSYKRHYCDTSCSSSDYDHRTKASRDHASHRSFQSSKTSQPICEALKTTDYQPTNTINHSQTTSNQIQSLVTTILEDQSSSSVMMPMTFIAASTIAEQQPSMNSTPVCAVQVQQCRSSSTRLSDPKGDLDEFIDEQLQATLKKHLSSSTTMNHEHIQQQRKTRLATLTKSETGKLMNKLDFTKQVGNLDHYRKQRELAMLAAKEGNYSLSYSIYTQLLHDSHYDYKLKSEILASRATTLLLEQKCFESIDDCTRAIAFNQWNKLAYVVRAASWMIKQEYSKAVDDYSKLFHFFDQSQHVLDLLNIAYEKLKTLNQNIGDGQSITIKHEKDDSQAVKDENNSVQLVASPVRTEVNPSPSLSLASPTTSFIQPAVYLCYPYQAYPTWYSTTDHQQQPTNGEEIQQPTYMITKGSYTSHRSLTADQSPVFSERPSHHSFKTKRISSKSIHSNNNAISSTIDSLSILQHRSPHINTHSQSNLMWINNPYRSF